jgi:hypothetical protein
MRILLDENKLGIFLGQNFEYIPEGIQFVFGVSTQYNQSNTTIIDTDLPYPLLDYVWKWENNAWVCIDQATVDDYLANQTIIYNQKQSKLREVSYNVQSDPIFFQWQRGTRTEQEWLDAVNAIKAEFPYKV